MSMYNWNIHSSNHFNFRCVCSLRNEEKIQLELKLKLFYSCLLYRSLTWKKNIFYCTESSPLPRYKLQWPACGSFCNCSYSAMSHFLSCSGIYYFLCVNMKVLCFLYIIITKNAQFHATLSDVNKKLEK